MRKFTKRILVIALTMVMAAGMAIPAFAEQTVGGFTGTIGEDVSYYPTGNTVTFKNGGTYDLTAKPGTSKNAEGDVLVGSVTGIIPEGRIPGVTAADAYYNITGWAV